MPHYYTMQTPNAALPHRRSAAQPILYTLGKYFWEFSLFIC